MKYTYSLLYKHVGDAGIHFISINTDVTDISDVMSMIQQKISSGEIPANVQIISLNLSGINE